MTATHLQFLLYIGDTWEFDATLHDAEGTVLNLGDADNIEWNLRNSAKRIVAALRLSDGIEVTNEVGGLCRITLLPMRTALLAEGTYSDEVRVTMSDGTISTQAVGSIVATKAGSKIAPDLAGDLEKLKAQRRSGIARTRMADFEVEYRPDSEIAAAISATQNEIAGASQVSNINIRSKRMAKMKNFIQSGNTITLTAPANVKSGGVVVVGSFAGIAAFDALQGAEVEVALTGVFELPAIGPITQGQLVYYEPGSGKVAAADSPTTPLLGAAVAAVGEAGTTCRVRLNGVVIPAAA